MNYVKLNPEDKTGIKEMSDLASSIVREHYDPILGAEQNDYMINKFQSPPAIIGQLENGYQYYFVCDDANNRVGF